MTRSPNEQRSSDTSSRGSIPSRIAERRARALLALVLAPALALGTLAVTASPAHAAVPRVTTPLPQGRTLPSTAVAFGSTIVWDTLRSSDTGSTWNADASLAQRLRWDFAGGGSMARVVAGTTTDTAVVYTPSTNTVQNFSIPTGYVSVNASYAAYANSVAPLSTGTQTAISSPGLGSLTTAPTVLDQQLSTSNALVWFGTTTGATTPNVVAVASTPTATPTPWVQINTYEDGTVSDTDFQYVTLSSTAVRMCKRSFSSFTSTPNCVVMGPTANYTTGYSASVRSLGALSLVHLWNDAGTTDQAWVISGTTPLTAKPVQLATGSIVRDAFRGGSPYLILQDANTVPSVATVDANGVLTPSFAIPNTTTSAPQLLAVTPDRVVGADSRDGSVTMPVWARTASAGGFGAETSLPDRAAALTASAGRTAITGPAGVTVYDRGGSSPTLADKVQPVDVNLSGPYVAELLMDPSTAAQTTKISMADGTGASTVSGWPVDLFGSQYVTAWVDSTLNGSMHVVVRDLTGGSPTTTYDLPAYTAGCYPGNVWGSTISIVCSGTSFVYNYRTGNALPGSTTGTPGTVGALGDGYALVHTTTDDVIWNLTTGTTTSLGCSSLQPVTTDGVGHIACSTATDLVWQDYSSLSTSAPRLLGVLAKPSVAFSEAGSTWSLAMDTTKALAAGSVKITNAVGTTVRTLATPAAADGSVRVTWNGLDDSNKPVRPGVYTYTLAASAADGTGAVTYVTGSGTVSGTVTVTAGSTLGMPAGGFAPVTPYRLLDTRVTGPALGWGATRSLTVRGAGGVPSTASAVVLNVTVTDTTAAGYLTVYPTGQNRPTASNLNWTAGVTIPNAVTVGVGPDGGVNLFQSGPGSASVVVDVAGYYLDGNVAARGAFKSLSPSRILDTRNDPQGPVLGYRTRDLTIGGAPTGGVPADASAVVLNVTVTNTTSNGYLTLFPAGGPQPTASNLNWTPGLTIPNLVTVKLGAGGAVTIYQSGPGSADVVVDVAGYFLGTGTDNLPGTFVALAPSRVIDTRPSPVGPGGETFVDLSNAPVAAYAVVMNTTVTETNAAGFLTVYPGQMSMPLASSLNWSRPGTTIPNLVTVVLGVDGKVRFHNGSAGSIQVIADTAGYYRSF